MYLSPWYSTVRAIFAQPLPFAILALPPARSTRYCSAAAPLDGGPSTLLAQRADARWRRLCNHAHRRSSIQCSRRYVARHPSVCMSMWHPSVCLENVGLAPHHPDGDSCGKHPRTLSDPVARWKQEHGRS